MKVGTTLIRSDGNPYYSPSFPRGGLAAAFAVKVTHFSGLTGFTITVQHRDENEVLFTDADSFPKVSPRLVRSLSTRAISSRSSASSTCSRAATSTTVSTSSCRLPPGVRTTRLTACDLPPPGAALGDVGAATSHTLGRL